jgi:hypothetical protein
MNGEILNTVQRCVYVDYTHKIDLSLGEFFFFLPFNIIIFLKFERRRT